MNVQLRDIAELGAGDSHFCFLLVPQFALLSLACAVEPLDNANAAIGDRVFHWSTCSLDGEPVADASGALHPVDGPCSAYRTRATVIVIGGERAVGVDRAELKAWLRHHSAFGSLIGGVGSGVYAMAAAGLLERRRATISGPIVDVFTERFPQTEVSRALVVEEKDRFTCAGGVATIEMMLAIMARSVSVETAEELARSCGYSPIRRLVRTMSVGHTWSFDIRDPKLRKAIEVLERDIEKPLTSTRVAAEVGLSTRQMERIFKKELGTSPKRFLDRMRLSRARTLLLETDMTITAIQIACGFQSHSHFSNRFRRMYGTSPRALRIAALGPAERQAG